jgi:hypothetical protein
MTKIGVKIGRLLHKIRENRLACVIKPYMASKPHEEPRADKLRGNLESYHPNIDAWLRWVAIWVQPPDRSILKHGWAGVRFVHGPQLQLLGTCESLFHYHHSTSSMFDHACRRASEEQSLDRATTMGTDKHYVDLWFVCHRYNLFKGMPNPEKGLSFNTLAQNFSFDSAQILPCF